MSSAYLTLGVLRVPVFKTEKNETQVDEGHRLRSKEGRLFSALAGMRARHRTLLTGTPLQNRLEELFMLLHFLEPKKFKDLEGFQSEYGELQSEDKARAEI